MDELRLMAGLDRSEPLAYWQHVGSSRAGCIYGLIRRCCCTGLCTLHTGGQANTCQ